jgi:hypothetical protein
MRLQKLFLYSCLALFCIVGRTICMRGEMSPASLAALKAEYEVLKAQDLEGRQRALEEERARSQQKAEALRQGIQQNEAEQKRIAAEGEARRMGYAREDDAMKKYEEEQLKKIFSKEPVISPEEKQRIKESFRKDVRDEIRTKKKIKSLEKKINQMKVRGAGAELIGKNQTKLSQNKVFLDSAQKRIAEHEAKNVIDASERNQIKLEEKKKEKERSQKLKEYRKDARVLENEKDKMQVREERKAKLEAKKAKSKNPIMKKILDNKIKNEEKRRRMHEIDMQVKQSEIDFKKTRIEKFDADNGDTRAKKLDQKLNKIHRDEEKVIKDQRRAEEARKAEKKKNSLKAKIMRKIPGH